MSEANFQVVFRGRRVEGSDPVEVKEKLARLFKIPVEKVNPMFLGKRVVIKKGVDEATARKYQAAMRQCGALAEIEPVNIAPSPAETETRDIRPPGGDDLDDVTLAEYGATIVEARPVEAPDIDTSSISMAGVGETIVEAAPVETPDIDTSSISMAGVGETIIETEPAAAPDIDTSSLSLGGFGDTLVEARPVEAPDIDTSALKLDEGK